MRRKKAGGKQAVPSATSDDPGSGKGPGILYLIATPIGNLEDITLRALRILQEVDWIAAEDTRKSSILLKRYQIDKPTLSYHAHNERTRIPQLLKRLLAGENGAVVTDAGTPAISDPGFLIAREARSAGIEVEVIPGPSAVLTALLASGLPCDRFVFLGYPPARSAARRRFLEEALGEVRTVVFFESPHRIVRCLEELVELAPSRPLAICREMTKRFEQVLRGSASELLEQMRRQPPRGEFTVVVGLQPKGDHA